MTTKSTSTVLTKRKDGLVCHTKNRVTVPPATFGKLLIKRWAVEQNDLFPLLMATIAKEEEDFRALKNTRDNARHLNPYSIKTMSPEELLQCFEGLATVEE